MEYPITSKLDKLYRPSIPNADFSSYTVTLEDRYAQPIVRNKDGHVMRTWVSPVGYVYVGLEWNGTHHFHVAHIVLLHFVGPRPSLYHTSDHKDWVKVNNSLANLSWQDKSAQVKHQRKRTNVGVSGSGKAVVVVHRGIEIEHKNVASVLRWLRDSDLVEVTTKDSSLQAIIYSAVKGKAFHGHFAYGIEFIAQFGLFWDTHEENNVSASGEIQSGDPLQTLCTEPAKSCSNLWQIQRVALGQTGPTRSSRGKQETNHPNM